MNDSKMFCIKFNFGVPLEDIFPPNGIHPRLQNLFHQTRVALRNSHLPLNDILKGLDISLDEALELKDATIERKLSYNDELSPSSFFWLLRHFLGLLPLPLFPCFTDGQRYSWEYLSTLCQLKKLRSSAELESEISWWIHKLPKANVLLIYNLIIFLRRICVRNNSLKRLDWNAIKAVTIYFSSSLFIRPFRPGLVTKSDRLYYPLLHYLIVNWSRIRGKNDFQNKLSPTFKCETYCSSKIGVSIDSIRNRFADSSCQTSSWLLLEKISKNLEKIKEEVENVAEEICELSKNAEKSEIFLEEGKDEQEFELEGEENEKKRECFELKLVTKNKKIKDANISGDYSNINCEDSPSYEEVLDEKNESTNSETAIYKKHVQKNITPKLIKQKITKANRSLVNVISKMNEKLKSTQEQLKSRSGSKLEFKYDLLKDTNVKTIQSLHGCHCVKESPNIKYKKLMTL